MLHDVNLNLSFSSSAILNENNVPFPEDSLALMHTTPATNGSVLKVTILNFESFSKDHTELSPVV